MKRFTSFAIAVLFLFSLSGVFAVAQSVEDQIKKLEMDRAAAVVKGDVAYVEKQTADDYMFINMFGQTTDKMQLIDSMKSGNLKLSADDISDVKVRVYGNTAVVTGKSDIKGMMGGKDASGQSLFTRVFVKKGGHWQTVTLQQTKASQ
jgi:ketosteroid isomerase-like protein